MTIVARLFQPDNFLMPINTGKMGSRVLYCLLLLHYICYKAVAKTVQSSVYVRTRTRARTRNPLDNATTHSQPVPFY